MGCDDHSATKHGLPDVPLSTPEGPTSAGGPPTPTVTPTAMKARARRRCEELTEMIRLEQELLGVFEEYVDDHRRKLYRFEDERRALSERFEFDVQ